MRRHSDVRQLEWKTDPNNCRILISPWGRAGEHPISFRQCSPPVAGFQVKLLASDELKQAGDKRNLKPAPKYDSGQ